jgi:hypothetical protein
MSTTYTVQELAQRYAESLVEFYAALRSTVSDRDRWVRESRDATYKAERELNDACKRQAELNQV